MKPPRDEPCATASDCVAKIIAALNQVFGPGFSRDNADLQDSGLSGGAFNLAITTFLNFPIATFNCIAPGRYSLKKWAGYLFGAGEHLHVPAGGEKIRCLAQPVKFQKWYRGPTNFGAVFDAHIDHGFPYHPVGFFIHLFRDVIFSKSRPPC